MPFAQAVAGPVLPPLVTVAPARNCPPATADETEVVVCGRRDDDGFRLKPLPERFAREDLPKVEVALSGGASVAAEAEAGNVGGIPTNRAMMRFKLKF